MKEINITSKDEGQTLIKILQKVLPQAGSSFLYKMLRKKNIVLNDKKADGKEKLQSEDTIKIYFSEDTLQKFEGNSNPVEKLNHASGNVDVIFENTDILILNKPAGILSQKAFEEDVSINEEMIAYLLNTGALDEENLKVFRPSVCNRLDRNTSGLILCGKTIHGLQQLTEMLKERSLHKYYRCIVKGHLSQKECLNGYLYKDKNTNKVQISKEPIADGQEIITEYRPVQSMELSIKKEKKMQITELEVLLVTGRTHQIRAHLSSIGFPILGDPKYGDPVSNRVIKECYHIDRQLLHAYRMEIPFLSQEIIAPVPEDFSRVIS